MIFKIIASAVVGIFVCTNTIAQPTLTLPDALNTAEKQYQKIKSKKALQQASEQNIQFQQSTYLPDLNLAAQQSFGTINAQHGPLYAFGGLSAASTSMPAPEQNWNAAFGSLYFANVNWNFFTFGKIKNQVNVANADNEISKADVEQEIFQQQVKVSAAYFNLLAAQRLKFVQEKNLERARVFLTTTEALSKAGLIPGVNASLARAEVSNAQSLQIKAYDRELEYAKDLAVQLGEDFKTYQLDSLFNLRLPLLVNLTTGNVTDHPSIILQKNKIEKSTAELKLIQAQSLPNFYLFGVLQGRGSGFDHDYLQDNTAYSKSYFKGAGIQRGNYLLGINLTWNITNVHRNKSKIKAQEFVTQSLMHDNELLQQELYNQGKLAEEKIKNALANHAETKVQLKAAADAFKQYTSLYKSGLATIVDWTQALYTLNRAEVEFEIAQNNVWQALLLKAAAYGDIKIITTAIQ